MVGHASTFGALHMHHTRGFETWGFLGAAALGAALLGSVLLGGLGLGGLRKVRAWSLLREELKFGCGESGGGAAGVVEGEGAW
jgi:hypothetical protein